MFLPSIFIIWFIFSSAYSQSQIVPLIKKFAGEDNPIGYAFTRLLDDSDIRQGEKIYMTPRSAEEGILLDGGDYPSIGSVADKASDLLGGLFSIFDETNRIPVPPLSTRIHKTEEVVTPKSQEHGALTLREHTCVRERKVDISHPGNYVDCVQFDKAVRCVSGHGNFSTVRIVECCEGYKTEDLHNGCELEANEDNLHELLPNVTPCVDSVSEDLVSSSTVFLPPDNYCKQEKKLFNIKDYTVKGIYHKYDLLNGQRLRTKNGGYVIAQEAIERNKDATLLNCVEIEEIPANDGTVFKMAKTIEASHETIKDYFSSDTGFDAFKNLLDDEIKSLLDSDTITTVFAFSDKTFSQLSPSLQARIRERRKCLKDLVKEHIFNGFHCSSRLNSTTLSAVSGNSHTFSRELINGTLAIRIDNAKIMQTDRVFSNGVVHVIDDVIFDQKFADWRDHLAIFEEEFLKLVEDVQPNDDKISALIVPPKDSLKDIADKKGFVLNHIVPLKVNDKTKKLISTAYGSKIPSTLNLMDTEMSPSSMIGCVSLIKPSVRLCDTDIHFVEKPLPVVDHNLLELLKHRKDMSVFTKFLTNSSILSDLQLENTTIFYTLFVPSDDAFSRNQIRALERNSTVAEDFVRRHIFKDFICSTKDISIKHSSVQNIQNEIFSIYRNGNKTYIGDSAVDEADIVATNGIIQVIDNELKSLDTLRRAPYRSILDIFTV